MIRTRLAPPRTARKHLTWCEVQERTAVPDGEAVNGGRARERARVLRKTDQILPVEQVEVLGHACRVPVEQDGRHRPAVEVEPPFEGGIHGTAGILGRRERYSDLRGKAGRFQQGPRGNRHGGAHDRREQFSMVSNPTPHSQQSRHDDPPSSSHFACAVHKARGTGRERSMAAQRRHFNDFGMTFR